MADGSASAYLGSTPSLNGEVLRALETEAFAKVVVAEPGEWRLAQAFEALAHMAPVPVEVRPDTRFLCSRRQQDDLEVLRRGVLAQPLGSRPRCATFARVSAAASPGHGRLAGLERHAVRGARPRSAAASTLWLHRHWQ